MFTAGALFKGQNAILPMSHIEMWLKHSHPLIKLLPTHNIDYPFQRMVEKKLWNAWMASGVKKLGGLAFPRLPKMIGAHHSGQGSGRSLQMLR
jgi:hypothetical protein